MKNALHLLACLQLFCSCVRADTVVVPNDRATQSGNSSQGDGFKFPASFQSVYTSGNFPAAAPILITGVAFRMDEAAGPGSFDVVIPRVTVQLSTYRGTPFNASSYEANKGIDNTTAYDAAVHWVVSDLPGATPNPFELRILFSKPFVYDPNLGALLMNYTAATPVGFPTFTADAQNYSDGTIGWEGFAGPFGQPGVTVFRNFVTEFEVTTIPEPSGPILLDFGLAIVVARRISKRNSGQRYKYSFVDRSICRAPSPLGRGPG